MSVDPTSASGTGALAGATASGSTTSSALPPGLGQDAFLNLLVTQLKNQDPTNPESGSAFIAELAQFSSLQQLTGINQSVTSLNEMFSAVFGAAGTAPATPAAQTSAASAQADPSQYMTVTGGTA